MKLPTRATAVGRKALAAYYDDVVTVSRAAESDNCMEDQQIYADAPCHLSIDRTARYQQEEAGGAVFSYTLRLPVGYDLRPADALMVTHKGVGYKGTAGLPVRGNLSVVVPIDGVQIA